MPSTLSTVETSRAERLERARVVPPRGGPKRRVGELAGDSSRSTSSSADVVEVDSCNSSRSKLVPEDIRCATTGALPENYQATASGLFRPQKVSK